jgi:hypothetical protein
LPEKQLRRELARIAQAAGVPYVSPHGFRRFAITQWSLANDLAGRIIHGEGLSRVMRHYIQPVAVLDRWAPYVEIPPAWMSPKEPPRVGGNERRSAANREGRVGNIPPPPANSYWQSAVPDGRMRFYVEEVDTMDVYEFSAFVWLVLALERSSCAAAGYMFMKNRGYYPGIGVGVGVLFGLIGILGLLCIPPKGWKPDSDRDSS